VLRERIKADTARVVILPAVLQVINSAREISRALDVLINTRRIQTLEEVDRQRKYISGKTRAVQGSNRSSSPTVYQ